MRNRPRNMLALRACWEIDGLAKIAHKHLQDEDGNEEYLPVLAMLRRVRRLASVQVSALTDPDADIASLTARIDESGGLEAT